MQINYDNKVDAAYIRISDHQIARDLCVNEYCIINLDENNDLVGIEFLFASKRLTDFEQWLDLFSRDNFLNVPE